MGNKQTYLTFAAEGDTISSSQACSLSKHLLKDGPVQIKTTMRCHLTPMKMATIKKTKTKKQKTQHSIGEEVEKRNL